MKATKYTVMNSITGLLLKWWSEALLTTNMYVTGFEITRLPRTQQQDTLFSIT